MLLRACFFLLILRLRTVSLGRRFVAVILLIPPSCSLRFFLSPSLFPHAPVNGAQARFPLFFLPACA